MLEPARRGATTAAVLPGPAALRVPFHRVPIDQTDVDAVTAVLRSGWLSTGPQTAAFETEFAKRLGARHAIALNSGTAAMHLALEALGVGPGDEVLVPAFTFTATAEVVVHVGARPVLVDVDGATLNVTASLMEAAITPRTRAVMPVHVGGVGCEMAPIRELAADRGLLIVEDAAHALPAWCDLGHAGTLGDAGAFSFYATKTMTTGEGGMLVTDRDDVAARARQMALHGISSDAYDRYRVGGRWQYDVDDFGFKCNMGDLAAALGRSQLQRLDRHRLDRARIAQRYDQAFAELPGVQLPWRRGGHLDSWHLYAIRLDLDRLDCDRDRIIDELTVGGIGTSVHFIPLHLHPAYQRRFEYRPGDMPVAESQYRRLISLPIWPGMTADDINSVIGAVAHVIGGHAR